MGFMVGRVRKLLIWLIPGLLVAQTAFVGMTVAGAPALAQTVSAPEDFLVDANGFTLYAFSQDVLNPGTSACTGACTAPWPPFLAPPGPLTAGPAATTNKLGTISRPDGTLQVTYGGLPLYHSALDQNPGDDHSQSGPAFKGTWSVVPP
jgi:predicted lipoprotein with Yx(FWY)xxD motif